METLNGEAVSPRDTEFYNFTLVEHGVYDVSAQIDYIVELTGAKGVAYFGHSQVRYDIQLFASLGFELHLKWSILIFYLHEKY